MHLILDIDGTLIASTSNTIIKRPYLEYFINVSFEIFERVSIWTAANEDHAKKVAKQIIPRNRE